MLITDECRILTLQLIPPLIIMIFFEVSEITAVIQNAQSRTSKTVFGADKELVPSEFPVSPQPMSNGAGVYIPPIIYLKNLINQTDTKVMFAINHALNVNKSESTKTDHQTLFNIMNASNKTDYISNTSNEEDHTRIYFNRLNNNNDSRDDSTAYNIMPLIVMLSLLVAVAMYIGLIIWRRILEKRYGTSEILLQDDSIEDDGSNYFIYEKPGK